MDILWSTCICEGVIVRNNLWLFYVDGLFFVMIDWTTPTQDTLYESTNQIHSYDSI